MAGTLVTPAMTIFGMARNPTPANSVHRVLKATTSGAE
jgi:hypothetical protein